MSVVRAPDAPVVTVPRSLHRGWGGVLAGAGLLLLAGCIPPDAQRVDADGRSLEGGPEQEARVYADLIERLIENGQYYAALAHVEEHRVSAGGRDARLDLFEARALYGLGYDGQARAIFLRMLNGPMAGHAHHGLGLIRARGDELDKALPHFVQAVRLRPTDIAMRNDLGFALMKMGRLQDAHLQLATALELAPENTRALHNLMLLMFLSGDDDGALALAGEADLSRERVAQIRRDAREFNNSVRRTDGGRR